MHVKKFLNNFCDSLWLWLDPVVCPCRAAAHRCLLQPSSETFMSPSLSPSLPNTPSAASAARECPINQPMCLILFFTTVINFVKKRQLKVTWWEKNVRKFYSLEGFTCWRAGQSQLLVSQLSHQCLGHNKLIAILSAPWDVSPSVTTDICPCVCAHFAPLLSSTPGSAAAWRVSSSCPPVKSVTTFQLLLRDGATFPSPKVPPPDPVTPLCFKSATICKWRRNKYNRSCLLHKPKGVSQWS